MIRGACFLTPRQRIFDRDTKTDTPARKDTLHNVSVKTVPGSREHVALNKDTGTPDVTDH